MNNYFFDREWDISENPPEGFGFIYKVTCLSTGLSYIGQTIKSVNQRWKIHCKSGESCPRLRRAIAKYGANSFTLVVVGIFLEELLNLAEISAIKEFDTISPKGYNLTAGGHAGRPCPEVLAKMSAWQIGVPKSDEHKKHISEAMTGEKHPQYGSHQSPEHIRKRIDTKIRNGNHKHSPETRRKMSLSKKGRKGHPISNELKNKLREAKLGKPRSEETKLKISLALKGKYKGANSFNLGRTPSEETKRKMSIASKERCNNPEWKERMSNISKKLWESEDYRKKFVIKNSSANEKRSQSMKKYLKDNPDKMKRLKEMALKISQSPDFKKIVSEKAKERWANPEFKERCGSLIKSAKERKKLDSSSLGPPKIIS